MTLQTNNLKSMSSEELKSTVIDLKRETLNLSFQRVNGQLTNSARFKTLRRDIARIKTILKQNETSKNL